MLDEPAEEPAERILKPADLAREKADEFRMHAELASVFEGCRKFDAEIIPKLDLQTGRDIQKTMGRLEKSKSAEHPVLPDSSKAEAAGLLDFPAKHGLSANDYHVHRRPGEVLLVRWLAGDQVETFYGRLQAHFDAALEGFKEDERQAKEWKKDPQTLEYLKALDTLEVKMAERYLRDAIREHKLFVLSTQSADEINIVYLTDYIMGVAPSDLAGSVSAPPDEPSERDLAWFFKLFSLRGMVEGTERMCFFVYLQKTEDTFESDEE